MIKKIGFFEGDKFIISCDGEKVEVFGTSDIAKQIKDIIDDESSFFNEVKNRKSNFDPVEHIALSSMNFMPEIVDYSESKLKEFKSRI